MSHLDAVVPAAALSVHELLHELVLLELLHVRLLPEARQQLLHPAARLVVAAHVQIAEHIAEVVEGHVERVVVNQRHVHLPWYKNQQSI